MNFEQMLHGYDNGHRLLAGSVILKSHADMDTIATLSDWSEYVAGSGGKSSYITAYPLRESGYYVIAKTWYADEMKRPGCVWTHSLLIPFDSIDGIDDFKRMLSLFERPSEGSGFEIFSHQIVYENKHYTREDFKQLEVDRSVATMVMLAFLTAKTQSLTFSGITNNRPYDELMLGAISAVPKGMLQYVSWTTGTSYSRKVYGKPLTCQIISTSSESLQEARVIESKPWLSYLMDALMQGDVNQGQLIRMFAEDIGESIDHYAAVVSVLYTLEDYLKTGKNRDERYADVFGIIAKSFPSKDEGCTIKKLCTSKIFSDRYCNDKTFFYLFSTLPLDGVFDIVDSAVSQRWGKYTEANHDEYLSLLNSICESGKANEWGIGVLRESVENLTKSDVTSIVVNNFHLFSTITIIAPKILDKVKWEELAPTDIENLLPLILDERTQGNFSQWESLFSALLQKGVEINRHLANIFFLQSDEATRILFDFVNADNTRYVSHVLKEQISRRTVDVLKWLDKTDIITANIAYAIVNVVDEHASVVVKSGAMVWKSFMSLQYQSLRAEIYAYLFSLSFNWPADTMALGLMRMSFEPLHKLESSGHLGYSNWSRISPYMESVKIWEEWDKCKKMRKTVVKRLKNAGVDKCVLAQFTSDIYINEQLIKMW